jgi:signal peptidase II
MTRRLLHLFLGLLLVGLVGCDHATKAAARATLADGRVVTLVPNVLDLRYAENRGTAFSLIDHAQGRTTLMLVVVSLFAIAAIAVYWWRLRGARASTQIACALIGAGAIGNVVDRVARGYVVDFVNLHHWPIFNVADVAITIGVAMLLLGSIARARARPVDG